MIRTLALALASAALSIPAAAIAAPAPTESELPFWMQTPCKYEDSFNCFWDANSAGAANGGHSWIARKVPGKAGMICVFYIERKFARSHDYCTATR